MANGACSNPANQHESAPHKGEIERDLSIRPRFTRSKFHKRYLRIALRGNADPTSRVIAPEHRL
jgi:hypothetical protein